MKLLFSLTLLLVLVNTGCQSFSHPKSTYTEDVSVLTNRRAGALKDAGHSIKSINPTAGYLEANRAGSNIPAVDVKRLQNAPVLLKTFDYASTNGDLASSVTAYWTGQR